MWETELIAGRLTAFIHDHTLTEPAPGASSDALESGDGYRIIDLEGILMLESPDGTEDLSSPLLEVSSVSFADVGTDEYPLLNISFTVSSREPDGREPYRYTYEGSIYTY